MLPKNSFQSKYLFLLPLLLVIFSTNCVSEEKNTVREDTGNNDNTKIAQVDLQKINIYYFHTSYRCKSCNMIEGLTKEAVTEEFSQELQKGTITFTPINVETDMNKHFIEKYKLVSKSIIVSKVLDNKEKEWKNLDQIWFLLRKPDKFKKYVTDEIKKYQHKS